jgi:hypothetical protein
MFKWLSNKIGSLILFIIIVTMALNIAGITNTNILTVDAQSESERYMMSSYLNIYRYNSQYGDYINATWDMPYMYSEFSSIGTVLENISAVGNVRFSGGSTQLFYLRTSNQFYLQNNFHLLFWFDWYSDGQSVLVYPVRVGIDDTRQFTFSNETTIGELFARVTPEKIKNGLEDALIGVTTTFRYRNVVEGVQGDFINVEINLNNELAFNNDIFDFTNYRDFIGYGNFDILPEDIIAYGIEWASSQTLINIDNGVNVGNLKNENSNILELDNTISVSGVSGYSFIDNAFLGIEEGEIPQARPISLQVANTGIFGVIIVIVAIGSFLLALFSPNTYLDFIGAVSSGVGETLENVTNGITTGLREGLGLSDIVINALFIGLAIYLIYLVFTPKKAK